MSNLKGTGQVEVRGTKDTRTRVLFGSHWHAGEVACGINQGRISVKESIHPGHHSWTPDESCKCCFVAAEILFFFFFYFLYLYFQCDE